MEISLLGSDVSFCKEKGISLFLIEIYLYFTKRDISISSEDISNFDRDITIKKRDIST